VTLCFDCHNLTHTLSHIVDEMEEEMDKDDIEDEIKDATDDSVKVGGITAVAVGDIAEKQNKTINTFSTTCRRNWKKTWIWLMKKLMKLNQI
jgi:hypothetical protein